MGSLVPEPYPRTAAALIPRRRWRARGGERREGGREKTRGKKIARREADRESRSARHLYAQSTKIGNMTIVRRRGIRLENYWRGVFFPKKQEWERGIGNYWSCSNKVLCIAN